MPEEVRAGDNYNQIPDMISIWIADYPATKREHHTHEIIYMFKANERDPIEIATSKFKTFIIELSKIEFKSLHHADMFSVWMMFREASRDDTSGVSVDSRGGRGHG